MDCIQVSFRLIKQFKLVCPYLIKNENYEICQVRSKDYSICLH